MLHLTIATVFSLECVVHRLLEGLVIFGGAFSF